MKRIRTSKSVGMLRSLRLIVCTLVATVGVRSGIAADKGPKVYGRLRPRSAECAWKSMKGMLVEYGPGVASPGHIASQVCFHLCNRSRRSDPNFGQ